MCVIFVKKVLELVTRNSPKEYISVQAYLAQYGIGEDAIEVSVKHPSGDEESSESICVNAYLEKHGLGEDSISISSVG